MPPGTTDAQRPPRAQWRYASIHSHPTGDGDGKGRSRIGIICRSRPWRQTATISLASLKSTRSTSACAPRTCVMNGHSKFICIMDSRPTRCFRLTVGVDDRLLNELVEPALGESSASLTCWPIAFGQESFVRGIRAMSPVRCHCSDGITPPRRTPERLLARSWRISSEFTHLQHHPRDAALRTVPPLDVTRYESVQTKVRISSRNWLLRLDSNQQPSG